MHYLRPLKNATVSPLLASLVRKSPWSAPGMADSLTSTWRDSRGSDTRGLVDILVLNGVVVQISMQNGRKIWKKHMLAVLWLLQRDSVTRFFNSIFSWFKTIWAFDKQAKVFSNYFSISRKYSYFKETLQCHTTESRNQNISKNSAVCIPPHSQTPRCASHRWVKLNNVESESKISLWLLLKGKIRWNPYMGEHIYHERKYLNYKKWVY